MLKIEMLAAGHGDCLWIEYGDPDHPRRFLIDGGARGTYKRSLLPKLRALPEVERDFELLVVTHIDADHIAGVLDLLTDEEVGFSAKDVWFNGYRHLPDEAPTTLGPVQGELLTGLLVKPDARWNGAFGGDSVVIPTDGDLPRIELDGGLVITLLSPTPDKLAELKPKWEKEVRKAGLEPGRAAQQEESPEGFRLLGMPDIDALANEPFSEDTSEANGSSIAFLAEFEDHRVLLAGDAHADLLRSSIRRLGHDGQLAIDAFKLPHHGSKSNVSLKLLRALDCQAYLFSTNGAYFKHPSPEAVARVIRSGGDNRELTFNYRTEYNDVWGGKPLRERYGYRTVYPDSDAGGVVLEWS